MGEFFPWREAWTLGIPALDLDHRQLAALLDRIGSRLTAAPQGVDGPGDDALIADLARLGALTRVHFRCEENLMRHSDYPDFHRHKAEHDLLLAEYTALIRELATGSPGVLDLGVLTALKAWFLGHLLDDDRRLAAHLHQVGIGTAHRRDRAPGSPSPARLLSPRLPSAPLS